MVTAWCEAPSRVALRSSQNTLCSWGASILTETDFPCQSERCSFHLIGKLGVALTILPIFANKYFMSQNVTLISVSGRESGIGTMIKYVNYLQKGQS